MTKYRIEQIELFHLFQNRLEFIAFAQEISKCFGNKFDFRNFRINKYMTEHNSRVVVAWKDTEVVGCYMARLVPNLFDESCKMFVQDLIYVREGHPKAARLLFLDLIDFGKECANHVITCVTDQTNISERTMLKHGFKKLETYYRLET